MRRLSIGEAVERTGITQATLRVWEARYGFPAPERLPSGHRRYSERDIELVRRVAADREAGAGLSEAIERAIHDLDVPARSLYAALRRSRPDLTPCRLTKRTMSALSQAIEHESISRAELPLLFGSFQRERHYRRAEGRWRELARTAELAIAFADFQLMRTPADGPIEIPVDRSGPLTREWAIVCDAPDHGVCLAAWEVPARLAAGAQPLLVDAARNRLDRPARQVATRQLALSTAICSRALSYVDGGRLT